MMRNRNFLASLVTFAIGCMAGASLMADDQQYGSYTGQFVLQGQIPARKVLFAAGDQLDEQAPGIAEDAILDPTLVVDRKTRGIANIVVYLRAVRQLLPESRNRGSFRNSVEFIHPDLQKTPKGKEQLEFNVKNFEFQPHILKVRTDQTVKIRNLDPALHNLRNHPFVNGDFRFFLPATQNRVVRMAMPEFAVPVKVTNGIYPHMTAYWVVLDHPYFAVTDAQGKFTIDKLPVDDYDFVFWHERAGFIDRVNRRTPKELVESLERIGAASEVRIRANKTHDAGAIAVPVEMLVK